MPRPRPSWSLCLLLVLSISQALWQPVAHATLLELTRVFIVSRLPGEPVATLEPRTSTPEAPITLYLVLEGRATGRLPTYFTEAPAIDLGWGLIPARQIRPWDPKLDGEIQIRWSQLEPERRSYDNSAPKFHFEPIAYQEVALPKIDGRWSWPASIHPTLLPDQAPELPTGLGIGRFKVRIEQQGRKLESPGAAGSFPGGIGEEVAMTSYRGDDVDPMASWVQARFNMPYVTGAYRRAKSDDSHQAMLGLGGDSFDLLAAAWRLAGHLEVGFDGAFLLDPSHSLKASVLVNRGRPEEGTYITAQGKPIEVGPEGIMPGDLLRSGNQAGVYVRDLPPLGVLSSSDLVVSALFQEPRRGTLQALLDGPVTILRWNEVRELQIDLKQLGFYKGRIDGEANPSLLTAVAALRSLVGLPPLELSELEPMMSARGGTFQAVPAAARFDALRRRMDELELTGQERRALAQRILARAAEACGAKGLAAMRWTPPREGLEARTWARAGDEPFHPVGTSFWRLEDDIARNGQTFVVADADRDGKVDVTGAPAPVQAAGPGIVVGLERGWAPKGASRSSKVLGNQVWLYLPRPDALVAYLSLGDVSVSLGQVVDGGAVIGSVGRTGEEGSRKRSPTRLVVAAFAGRQGGLSPLDPAAVWGSEVAAHPMGEAAVVPAAGAIGAASGGANEMAGEAPTPASKDSRGGEADEALVHDSPLPTKQGGNSGSDSSLSPLGAPTEAPQEAAAKPDAPQEATTARPSSGSDPRSGPVGPGN